MDPFTARQQAEAHRRLMEDDRIREHRRQALIAQRRLNADTDTARILTQRSGYPQK